jgi:hypothetical protein
MDSLSGELYTFYNPAMLNLKITSFLFWFIMYRIFADSHMLLLLYWYICMFVYDVGTAHSQANVTVRPQVSLLNVCLNVSSSNDCLLAIAKHWYLSSHCNVCLNVGSSHNDLYVKMLICYIFFSLWNYLECCIVCVFRVSMHYVDKQIKGDWCLNLIDIYIYIYIYAARKAHEPFIHPHLHTLCFGGGAVHRREFVLNNDREFTEDECSLQNKQVTEQQTKSELMIIIIWEMTPCGCYKNRRFGGSYRLHLQGARVWAGYRAKL